MVIYVKFEYEIHFKYSITSHENQLFVQINIQSFCFEVKVQRSTTNLRLSRETWWETIYAYTCNNVAVDNLFEVVHCFMGKQIEEILSHAFEI